MSPKTLKMVTIIASVALIVLLTSLDEACYANQRCQMHSQAPYVVDDCMKSLEEGILHIQAAHMISIPREIAPSIPVPLNHDS